MPAAAAPATQATNVGTSSLMDEQAADIGADAVEGGVPEGELAGLAEDQTHADGEDGVETGLGHDVERIVAVGDAL